MSDGSQLLCPRKDMPGSIWLPGYWQRRHVMYTSVFLSVILLLALEFSFSTLFKKYPLYFMLIFKVTPPRSLMGTSPEIPLHDPSGKGTPSMPHSHRASICFDYRWCG